MACACYTHPLACGNEFPWVLLWPIESLPAMISAPFMAHACYNRPLALPMTHRARLPVGLRPSPVRPAPRRGAGTRLGGSGSVERLGRISSSRRLPSSTGRASVARAARPRMVVRLSARSTRSAMSSGTSTNENVS
jgi:hypothetical protein